MGQPLSGLGNFNPNTQLLSLSEEGTVSVVPRTFWNKWFFRKISAFFGSHKYDLVKITDALVQKQSPESFDVLQKISAHIKTRFNNKEKKRERLIGLLFLRRLHDRKQESIGTVLHKERLFGADTEEIYKNCLTLAEELFIHKHVAQTSAIQVGENSIWLDDAGRLQISNIGGTSNVRWGIRVLKDSKYMSVDGLGLRVNAENTQTLKNILQEALKQFPQPPEELPPSQF